MFVISVNGMVVNGMVGFNTTVFAYGCYGKNTFVATPGKNLGMGPPIPYKSLNFYVRKRRFFLNYYKCKYTGR